MKRGKDDEKLLEPMFPRLHVNDADKGGPRAPPRNKMALYEQLSILSQRFSNQETTLPLNSSTNSSSLVPPRQSSQSCAEEMLLFTQQHDPSSARVHAPEKFVTERSCKGIVRSLTRCDLRKMVGEGDDFAVPVFLSSERVQSLGGYKSGIEKKKSTSLIAPSSDHSSEIQEVNPVGTKLKVPLPAFSTHEVREQVKENTKRGTVLSSPYLSARGEMNVDKSESDCYRENCYDASLRQESRNRFNEDGENCGIETDNGVESQLQRETNLGGPDGSPDEVDNGRDYCRSEERVSQQQRNEEASDDISESSMVDSISSTNVSPDDLVGIIGQKRFWRARKTINNQQRLFAVQVFELHRLIKVQRLIAASPDVLLDDVTYLGRASAKSSPVKKLLPSQYIVKPLAHVAKHRDDLEKNDHHIMECLAENAFGRTSVSSGNTNSGHQPSNYMPFVGNPPGSPAPNRPQMTPIGDDDGCSWCFPRQPTSGNHQWLIPVMSPSEGLVYKPYPGPGHTGSACGAYYGHFMPTPMAVGNFMGGPTYGVPTPAFHPSVGFLPPGHLYFPPYGVPNCSGQHQPTHPMMNQFSHLGNLENTRQHSSRNFSPNSDTPNGAPTQKLQPHPQASPRPTKSQPRTRDGSSHGGRRVMAAETSGNSYHVTDENNSNPHEQLLTTTTTTTRTTITTAGPVATRVIRVVPHNAKAASENAARIFKSIQEERKHYDC